MKDLETRERLLAVAARLFADRGFAKVTIRDICRRARANVAAVNYHFHGKTGLYEAVLRSAILTMRGTTEAAQRAGANRPPADSSRSTSPSFCAAWSRAATAGFTGS